MIDKIGVIGAGADGQRHRPCLRARRLDVTLIDVSRGPARQGDGDHPHNMDRQVKRSLITAADEKAALGRITTGTQDRRRSATATS